MPHRNPVTFQGNNPKKSLKKINFLNNAEPRPQNAIKALGIICNRNSFPIIYDLLLIIATLPVATCTCERSFSLLKLLKTCLRNYTGKERLNGLVFMFLELGSLQNRPRRSHGRVTTERQDRFIVRKKKSYNFSFRDLKTTFASYRSYHFLGILVEIKKISSSDADSSFER
nr:unnamed protein product [Callosobruchus chinensis]